jgi:hypothetical protein
MPTQEEVPGFRSVAMPNELAGDIHRVSASVARAIDSPRVEDETGIGHPPRRSSSRHAALEFSIHVSVRYHARRRAWYDRLHRLTMLVIAAGASAAVAAILGGLLRGAEYLCAAVAVAGALELAYSLPERARNEDALYRRFNALAADIAEAGLAGEAQLQAWEARRLLIRADADDRLEVLRRICHNLEAEARGYAAETRYTLWPWQRLVAQLVSLPPLRPLGGAR